MTYLEACKTLKIIQNKFYREKRTTQVGSRKDKALDKWNEALNLAMSALRKDKETAKYFSTQVNRQRNAFRYIEGAEQDIQDLLQFRTGLNILRNSNERP